MKKTKSKGSLKDTDYPELLPPEGDKRLGYKIFQILDEILQDKNDLGLPGKWNRNYELGKNKHWKSATKKASLVSANLLFSHRQRTKNMLTDNNPTFNVAKIGNHEEEIYQTLLHTADFWWRDQEQQHVLEESVDQGETKGCTVEKVSFNPDLEFGLGEVETEVVDPFYFGIYPVKAKTNQKAEANFHFWPMSLREAKRRWPQFKDKITTDTEFLKDLGDKQRDVIGGKPGVPRGYWSTFASVVKNMLNVSSDGKSESDELLVVEAWVKDYTMLKEETIFVESSEGEGVEFPINSPEAKEIIGSDEVEYQKITREEPKYKGFIRCVQTCNGGELVLSDRSNPSINPTLPDEEAQKAYLYDKFPFSLNNSISDTASIWGMSDYEQLEGLQLEIDKAISQATLVKDKVARIKLINPKTSGVSNSELTNYPGIINPKNSLEAQGIRYLNAPKVPFDIFKILDIYKDFFFLVAGTFELEQAQTPGREVIAYKAIAALLEYTTTMMRGKLRNYSKMIRERGRMYLSHVMNWYTEDRWISYEDDGKEITQKIRADELRIPVKLNVVSGSTMPVSKVQEREEAIALAKDGRIDNQELLKRLDWPNWKKVIERMQAGPLGEFLQKLKAIDIPDDMIQLFQQLIEIDMEDVQKAVEKGEVPTFPQMVQAIIQAQSGKPQLPSPEEMEVAEKNAKIQETNAKIREIDANIRLSAEKIMTERVEQRVKLEGIEFDEEKLKIERAKVVEEIQRDTGKEKVEKAKIMSQAVAQRGQGPYREKGMASNNQEV